MISFSKILKNLLLTSLSLFPTVAIGDTFILNNGKQLKGKIIDETYEHYLLKVEVAENVLSERRVLIKDVKKIIKDDESESDYAKIKSLFPTSDLLKMKDYEKIKRTYFKSFYASHPKSKRLQAVKTLELTLDKEYNNLKSGGLKINGKLISKEQIELNEYEIMALLEYKKMRKLVKSKKYISALRRYETMKREYKHTRQFPMAAKVIHRMLPKFTNVATKLQSSVTSELEKRERYLNSLPNTDKTRTRILLENADKKYAKSLLRAKNKLKTKWLPLYKYDEKTIKSVLDHAKKEIKWLEKVSANGYYDRNKGSMVDGGALYRDILTSIKASDIEHSNKLLSDFERLRVPVRYTQGLKQKIATAKRKLEEQLAKEKLAAQEKSNSEEAKNKANETAEPTPKKEQNEQP